MSPAPENLIETGSRGEIVEELLRKVQELDALQRELTEHRRFVSLVREMFPTFYVTVLPSFQTYSVHPEARP
jgi:hypothetical protein